MAFEYDDDEVVETVRRTLHRAVSGSQHVYKTYCMVCHATYMVLDFEITSPNGKKLPGVFRLGIEPLNLISATLTQRIENAAPNCGEWTVFHLEINIPIEEPNSLGRAVRRLKNAIKSLALGKKRGRHYSDF